MNDVKKCILSIIFVLSLSLGMGLVQTYLSPAVVYAAELEDNLGEDEGGNGDELDEGSISEDDKKTGDFIKNRRGFTGDQLDVANRKLSPITNIAGYIVGGGIVILFGWIFVITVLDLIYIAIPPIRGILYKGAEGGAMGGSPMMGGYGMRGGYGMQAQAMQGQQGAKPIQWISDEAVQCTAMLSGGGMNQQGGMMAGGVQGNMGMPQQVPMKSVIAEYFKKRIFFMILLAISAIVLTSSVLLGTGVNLAQWLIKMIDGVNNSMPK